MKFSGNGEIIKEFKFILNFKNKKHLKNQIIKEREMFFDFSKKYYEHAEEDYEFMCPTIVPYVKVKCISEDIFR